MYLITKCRFAILSIIIVFLSLISGCSATPQAKDAEQFFFERFVRIKDNQSTNLYKIIGFKKIKALKANQLGKDMYVMVCQGTIEFQRDCFYSLLLLPFGGGPFILISKSFSIATATNATKGQQITIENNVNFIKTEKGWQVDE